MPHIIVKMYPGRDEKMKEEIAEKVAAALQSCTGHKDRALSVSVEEVPAEEWAEKVYRPDIIEKADLLYKRPGYVPEGLELPAKGE